MGTRRNMNIPSPEEIATLRDVRQRLLREAHNSAPFEALARLIGFSTLAFKIQDRRIVRAIIETNEKTEEPP